MKKLLVTTALIASSLGFAGTPKTSLEQMKQDVISNYTNLVYANYTDALQGAIMLEQEIGNVTE